MQTIAAQNLVENGIDEAIAKFNESVHFTGGAWLAGKKLLEFFLPRLEIETKAYMSSLNTKSICIASKWSEIN